MLTFCNSYVLWLLRCVQLRLVTVTFCDVAVVWCYVLSQYPRPSWDNWRCSTQWQAQTPHKAHLWTCIAWLIHFSLDRIVLSNQGPSLLSMVDPFWGIFVLMSRWRVCVSPRNHAASTFMASDVCVFRLPCRCCLCVCGICFLWSRWSPFLQPWCSCMPHPL